MFELALARDNFTFAAAHFLVGVKDGRERIHGHNYVPSIRISADEVGANGVLVDFGDLKAVIREETSALNHRLLLPARNPDLQVVRGRQSISFRFADEAFLLPLRDVVLIDAGNMSCELLASFLCKRLARRISQELRVRGRLTVELAESVGQSASYSVSLDYPLARQSSGDLDEPRRLAGSSSVATDDSRHLITALHLAQESSKEGGSPFGAVIVRSGEVVARGRNSVRGGLLTDHAEIVAIRAMGRPLSDQVGESTLYSSCEPCMMCLFSVYYAGIRRIVYGSPIETAIAYGSGDPQIECATISGAFGLSIEVVGPLHADQAEEVFAVHKKANSRL